MASPTAVKVGQHEIGEQHPPFVIAELSANHNGDLGRALDTVDAIAASGAHALKLQTYTADTLTLDVDDPAFKVDTDHDLWGGRGLYQLYEEAHTPWEWHAELFERARGHGLVAFSSPFDPTAVEFLEGLGVPMYKTASAEIVDLPLIREIARTGKPIVMSTGMATLAEIDGAVTAARDAGCTQLVLLACTASYPADATDARLGNIAVLREAFGVPVGLSDHSEGVGVAVAAVALGAVAVEKHVTLDRTSGGVDADFSLTPDELALLRRETAAAWAARLGGTGFGPTEAERAVLRLRRSLYVVRDVRAGESVTVDNVRSIRPAGGLPPAELERVTGRAFTRDAPRGTPLSWDLL